MNMPMDDLPIAPRPGRWAVAKDLTDVLSKAVPLAAGMTYLIGYFVIALQFAEYKVPVTQLVNAKYFVAGLLSSMLFWLTLPVPFFRLSA